MTTIPDNPPNDDKSWQEVIMKYNSPDSIWQNVIMRMKYSKMLNQLFCLRHLRH